MHEEYKEGDKIVIDEQKDEKEEGEEGDEGYKAKMFD